MPLLRHSKILELHRAAMDAGLADKRDALLSGILNTFRSTLPSAPDASSQILRDLDEMNKAERLVGGDVPLRIWLDNAIETAGGRRQVNDFEKAHRAIDRAIVTRKAVAWVSIPVGAAVLASLAPWAWRHILPDPRPPGSATVVVVPPQATTTAASVPTAGTVVAPPPVTTTPAAAPVHTSTSVPPVHTAPVTSSKPKLSGSAVCAGTSCDLTTTGGLFERAIHVCLVAEEGGERATCQVGGEPRGSNQAKCGRSGLASGVPLKGRYSWQECGP